MAYRQISTAPKSGFSEIKEYAARADESSMDHPPRAQHAPAIASEPAGASSASDALPALDQDDLLARVGGDWSIITDVLHAFIQEGPNLISCLHQSLATGDLPALRRHAHSLRGASATAGAAAIHQQALLLEAAARSADLPTVLKHVRGLHRLFRTFRERALEAIKQAPWIISNGEPA